MKRFNDIRRWAADRNLILGSNPQSQFLKTLSELGELADGINKQRREEIIDGIGDVAVTLVIIAAQCGADIEKYQYGGVGYGDSPKVCAVKLAGQAGMLSGSVLGGHQELITCHAALMADNLIGTAIACGLSFDECVEHAWNEIKDRKGCMVDGVFIKEGDVPAPTMGNPIVELTPMEKAQIQAWADGDAYLLTAMSSGYRITVEEAEDCLFLADLLRVKLGDCHVAN